jgi:hypothetical protein
MNCTRFNDAFKRSIEMRGPLEAEANDHLAECADCRLEWQTQSQLDLMIARWQTVGLTRDFADPVLAELARLDVATKLPESNLIADRDATTTRSIVSGLNGSVSRPGMRLGVLGSVAASLMAATLFFSQFERQPTELLTGVPPVIPRDSAIAEVRLDVSQTLSEVLADLRSEYREVADETRSVALDLVNSIPGRVEIPDQSMLSDIEIPTTPRDVGQMWRPIGSRVETALGFLWQAIPQEIPPG